MRLVLVIILVPWSSPLDSPSTRNRRSEPSLPWSTLEVEDDKWGPFVSDSAFKWNFFYFQIWMNSDVICYFCVDLFRAPKIIKFFVWPLCSEYYLGKIWNIIFQHFLNVMKIAQLINKWISMIFLGSINYPKNYEICFDTYLSCDESLLKFWAQLE